MQNRNTDLKKNESKVNMIRNESIIDLLDSMEGTEFYGEVVVSVKNGKIVKVDVKQTFVDEGQIYEKCPEYSAIVKLKK